MCVLDPVHLHPQLAFAADKEQVQSCFRLFKIDYFFPFWETVLTAKP